MPERTDFQKAQRTKARRCAARWFVLLFSALLRYYADSALLRYYRVQRQLQLEQQQHEEEPDEDDDASDEHPDREEQVNKGNKMH